MPSKRKVNIPEHLKQPYQSEYDRLNVDPTPPGIDVRSQKPITQNAPVRHFHGEQPAYQRRGAMRNMHQQQAKPTTQPQVKPTQGKPIQENSQMPVQVGNHEDQMWFDDELVADQPRQDQSGYIDNNDYVNIPGEHYLVRTPKENAICKLCGEERPRGHDWAFECSANPKPRQAPVIHDPVPMEDSMPADDTSRWVRAHEDGEKAAQTPLEQEFSLDDLVPGELLVLYNNQVIYRGQNDITAKKAVESILLQFQPSTEDVIVLKRVAVDFGVSFM